MIKINERIKINDGWYRVTCTVCKKSICSENDKKEVPCM